MAGTDTQVITFSMNGDPIIDSLLYGRLWDPNLTFTYAFPTSFSVYTPFEHDHISGFTAFTEDQQKAAKFALQQSYGTAANDGFCVEGFTNLNILEGSDATANARFANSSTPDTAFTYMLGNPAVPHDNDESGDAWFRNDGTFSDPVAGNYAWHSILHETGHALGLKHPFETFNGFPTIDPNVDGIEYSIMTYRDHPGDNTGGYNYGHDDAPQTFMMYDIAALQKMYGADYTTNSDDTVYSWNPTTGSTFVNGTSAFATVGNVIFATIWDGGGTDTYDLSSYTTNLDIDLNPGSSSVFDGMQRARTIGYDMQGEIYNAMLFNGDTRSMIENATGGSENDHIIGNSVNNLLKGAGGNDTLAGNAGSDNLNGSIGSDTLSGNGGNDTLYGGDNEDELKGGNGADRLISGAGQDTLYGNDGADVFVFNATADDTDWLEDLQLGVDKIEISNSGCTSWATLKSHVTEYGWGVEISTHSGDYLHIEGIYKADLSDSSFIFV